MTPQRTAEEQQQHTAEVAWSLLLQHDDSIRTQLPLVCKLLCCSKWLAAVVAHRCAGQLDIPCPEALEQAQAARWLRKHARLLRSLHSRIDGTSAYAAACVEAMVAAGPPQSLMLQSLATRTSETTLPLLEQLPASRLTHLDTLVIHESLRIGDRAAFVARVSAALGRLTALRSLKLRRFPPASAPGLSGLSALTQLTALRFDGPLSDLRHVPHQLLELELANCAERQQLVLDLRHLTSTTALSIVRMPVKEGDVQPAAG